MCIGIQRFPPLRYMLNNLVASFIWAKVVVLIGIQLTHYLHLIWLKILPSAFVIYVGLAVILSIVGFKLFICCIPKTRAK